ncbi:hypothetical protein ABMC88_11185 [Sulfitobacter sp. HNIBRBA2951]|uniref:calcium-binding protein n=1 Tax=Sulfitobacter aquimarinus TaxID=3158557 RepID=UPI0032DE4F8E
MQQSPRTQTNGLAVEGDVLTNIENVIGTGFNDYLRGNADADEMTGGDGNDYIASFEGNDLLIGGIGNDRLFGGVGEDSLRGGDGDDLLVGGSELFDESESDVFNGGAGADTFELYADRGSDVIEDFALGVDTLRIGWQIAGNGGRLSGDEPASAAEYLSGATVVDGNLVICSGATLPHSFTFDHPGYANTLTLLGVTDVVALANDIELF